MGFNVIVYVEHSLIIFVWLIAYSHTTNRKKISKKLHKILCLDMCNKPHSRKRFYLPQSQ